MGIWRRAAIGGLVCLAACAKAAPPPPAPHRSPASAPYGGVADRRLRDVSAISFQAVGQEGFIESWRIDSDGNGVWRSGRPAVERPFHAGPRGYLRIRTILQTVERHAGRQVPCDAVISDRPNPVLRWTVPSGDMSVSIGACISPEAARIRGLMLEARNVAAGFAERPALRQGETGW